MRLRWVVLIAFIASLAPILLIAVSYGEMMSAQALLR